MNCLAKYDATHDTDFDVWQNCLPYLSSLMLVNTMLDYSYVFYLSNVSKNVVLLLSIIFIPFMIIISAQHLCQLQFSGITFW